MTIRTRHFAAVTVPIALLLLAAPAWAAGPSTKDKADYNKSMAAVMGGVAQVKSANANMLKTIGDHFQKMVAIRLQQQELRKAKMANDMTRAQNFYAKRKLNNDYRETRRPKKPLTTEQLQQIAKRGVPARSASFRSPGRVSTQSQWPAILTRVYYVKQRAELEKLLAERAAGQGGPGTQNCLRTQAVVDQMKDILKSRVREMSPMDYLGAKKYLDVLAYEARFVAQPGLTSVASNN